VDTATGAVHRLQNVTGVAVSMTAMQQSEFNSEPAAAGQTTVVVQRYLDALAGDAPADPILRMLLERSIERLEQLCSRQLRRAYPRLTLAPMGLETGDLIAAIVERLLKATRDVRPKDVRQFFALANRHIRWELNSLARKLDETPRTSELPDAVVQADITDSALAPTLLRMLAAIEDLPEDDREVLDLVRVQGLSHAEAAEVVGVSTKTIQRRLHDALALLAERLDYLDPPEGATPGG
jgi:RNA polymerase sigma factor (sigma-70 family)